MITWLDGPDADRVVVTLRRIADGRTVSFKHGYADGCEFWWTEGNGACNCNRWLAFMFAAGEDHDPWDATCDDPWFRLVSITVDGVAVVVDEEEVR